MKSANFLVDRYLANAIGYAEHRRRSHDAVIRVYDDVSDVVETYQHAGEFKEW